MSTYINGSFRNKDNQDIVVEIHSPYGLGEYKIGENDSSPIKFAKNPVEITTECDDMFTHIIKKECSITLVTKIFLGALLFTGNDRNVTVKIYNGNSGECLFSGYVKPKSFSQAWANDKEEFEINAYDYLSTLDNHYLTDMTSYQSLKSQNNILSFTEYLARILPTYTWYDNSKTVDGYNVFDTLGVSMNVFLGDDEDKIMSNEEILNTILTYLNLHAIQEGNNIFLFDWNSIGTNMSTWYNLFSNNTITVTSGTISVGKNDYASNDTNLSMADIYNRVSVKASFEKKDEVGTSILDSGEIKYYNNYKQLYFSELFSGGSGSSSADAFREVVKQIGKPNRGWENIVYPNYDAWERADYYMKWGYNPNWRLWYKGEPIEKWLEFDTAGNVVNQHRIMQFLKTNPFMPAIVSIGKNENVINYKRTTRLNADGTGVTGKIDMKNYIVISVNGNLDDSIEEYQRINTRIYQACGNTNDFYESATGLLSFESDSGLFSPADDDTTNYLIFSGNMILNPVRKQSGWGDSFIVGLIQGGMPDIKMKTHIKAANEGYYPTYINVRKEDGRYAQMFYTCYNPAAGLETFDPNILMCYPFVEDEKSRDLEYNYSAHGDSRDTINKFEVLVCQMKIGDKYLVETYSGNKQKPTYVWRTYDNCPTDGEGNKMTTFTLGFDPEIDDFIIGKEYEICNTADGRYTNNKGLAIPIKKSDALSGKVSFKILSVCNGQFNQITRRHPTMFRHTKYYDNWKNVLSHVSSIWLKDFKMYVVSDNKGYDVDNDNTDLVYFSEENHDSIEKHDDIEFKINTQPSTEVLLAHGIGTNVSNTNVINMRTNVGAQELTETRSGGEHAIAEHLYINQYYQQYSQPRIIVESTLKNNNSHPMLQKYVYTDDANIGGTIPLSSSINLKENTITLTSIQVG